MTAFDPKYLETLQMIRHAQHDLDVYADHPPMRREAAGYQYAAAKDMRVLAWLAGKVGLPNLIVAFGLGVTRAEINMGSGMWSPIDTRPRDGYGFQVITMPVLEQPDIKDSVVDIIAFDAEDPTRCWLRAGNVDLIGEAALDWARYTSQALKLYASPWSWLTGWTAVLQAWELERRSAEADCRAMAAKACIEAGRTGWESLRWAETTLRVWMDQQVPRPPQAGLHGVCVLDHSLSYERLFEGVSALVGESPAHAQWIDRKLNDDRKRRRLEESLPQVGFVSRKTESAAAAE